MKIYYDNQVDNATVTSDQTITNYPPSNVKDSRLTRIYKGAEYSELQIDAGGGLKNISEAYTNLVQDPTDLTTGNWTKINGVTATSTTKTIKGYAYTKLESNGTTDGQVTQSVTVTASQYHTGRIIIEMGQFSGGGVCQLFLLLTGQANSVSINFSTKAVTLNIGDKIDYQWYDDKTIEISLTTNNLSSGTSLTYRIDLPNDSSSGDYIYATACQLVNNTKDFYPFIDGSKSADVITEDFTMPDRFIVDCIFTPFFQYDISGTFPYIFSFAIDSSNRLIAYYDFNTDKYVVFWNQDGINVALIGFVVDDGTSLVKLNQRMRATFSLDLASGEQTGSRFIMLALETGDLSEDDSWSGTPAIKTTSYDTLYIGSNALSGTAQSNANYEYLRIYEGLLVGDVNSSEDIDELLKDKKVLLDVTYQSKITATDLLLANTTINDGDTILLRANDVDSFNVGTPVDEVVAWDKNIIHHNFTKASHQYWWLSVNSSNAVEIGRMFLGESYTPPGIGPTVTEVDNTADVKSLSIGGQTYGDARYNFKQFITTFPALTHDEKADIQSFFDSITNITPFFIEFDEECSDLERYYVTLDQSDVRFTALSNPAYYTASINYLESK